jgi:hypothetical protein
MAKQRPVSGWGACGGGGCGDGRSSRRAMKAPRSGRAGRRAARRTTAMPRPSRTKMLVATPVDAMREGGRGSYALRERGIIRWLGFWSGFGVGFEGRGGLGEGRKTARVKP